MTSTQAPTEVYVGIDAHKDTLEVMLRELGEVATYANTATGRGALCETLLTLPVVLIVVEASGGVERGIVTDCVQAGLPLAVVNPTRVRNFAKAQGVLAKTDAIDAQVIADFAALIRPEPQKLRDACTQELDALVRRRNQIKKMLTAERNRRHAAPPSMRERIQEHIAWLQAEKEALMNEMLALIKARDTWRAQYERDTSIPGVGKATVTTLIAQLPELGQVNRQRIAALVGLAPYNHDSAHKKGHRHIYGGRSDVRAALYMAVLAGIRCKNPIICEFYERLLARGKLPKVAITACMRKLLTILNAMERDKQSWRAPIAAETSS